MQSNTEIKYVDSNGNNCSPLPIIETTITNANNLPKEAGIYVNNSGFTDSKITISTSICTPYIIEQSISTLTTGTVKSIKQTTMLSNGTIPYVYERMGYSLTDASTTTFYSWQLLRDAGGITASKLSINLAGTPSQPIYFNNGLPTAIAYTLGAACEKGVSDSTSASALSSTDTNVPTVRDIYYGMPSINGTKASTASIYAPTSGGTSGNILTANGSTSTPTWLYAFDAITSTYGGFTYPASSHTTAYPSTNRHIMKIPYSANFDIGIEWQFTSAATTSSYHDETITFVYTYAANPLVLTTYSETNDSQCSNMYGWIKQGTLGTGSVKIRNYKGSQIMFLVIGLVSKS